MIQVIYPAISDPGHTCLTWHERVNMSVTVSDILKLPCLRGARLAAGKNSLQKVLTTVSVLEYMDPGMLQKEMLDRIDFLGGEIVITAFAAIAQDVEQQCLNIRRLSEVGEVGLILYYVGVLMPEVDRRLIELADSLDFVLIVMPEGRMDLRYSEAIVEIMGTIFEDQKTEASMVSDVLEQVSRLPAYQRTVDTVLRIIRERLRVSLILLDGQERILGQAMWPFSLELDMKELLTALSGPSGGTAAGSGKTGIMPGTGFEAQKGPLPEVSSVRGPEDGKYLCMPLSRTRWGYRCLLKTHHSLMQLCLVKDGEPLTEGLVAQIGETVRLAVNIWSREHAEVNEAELVAAILQDEPLKMRRLAEIFHIDIASVHAMWVIRCDGEGREKRSRGALHRLREELKQWCNTVVSELYEGYAVAFMDWPSTAPDAVRLSEAVLDALPCEKETVSLTRCHQLSETADVRKAFLLIREHLSDAGRIWPKKRCYTLEEVDFAAQCRQLVDKGEEAASAAMAPLLLLEEEREGAQLRHTLCVWLLDADGSTSRCAALLFVHRNTVKYRLGCIRERLGYAADKLPEQFGLYRAAALWRLMEGHMARVF